MTNSETDHKKGRPQAAFFLTPLSKGADLAKPSGGIFGRVQIPRHGFAVSAPFDKGVDNAQFNPSTRLDSTLRWMSLVPEAITPGNSMLKE